MRFPRPQCCQRSEAKGPLAGLITSHHRPTLYSPSSRTALAEAELEYKDDHVSRSVYVSFPVVELGDLAGVHSSLREKPVSLAVWTTTAWTMPSNVVRLYGLLLLLFVGLR